MSRLLQEAFAEVSKLPEEDQEAIAAWLLEQLAVPEDISYKDTPMDENKLLERVTVNPNIFGGKPIIRGRRLAVEHVLGMLAAGDSPETILSGYPWLEPEDIQACLVYARRIVGHERVDLLLIE